MFDIRMGCLMRLGHYRWVYALVIFLCSAPSYAQDYYWRNVDKVEVSSAVAACYAAWTPTRKAYYMNLGYPDYSGGLIYDSETQRGCQLQATARFSTVSRYGSGCTDSIYDSASGGCIGNSPDAGKVCDPTKDPLTGFPKITDTSGACVDFTALDQPATCKYLSGTAGTITPQVFIKFDSDGEPQIPDMQKFGCAVESVVRASCKLPAAPAGISLAPVGMKCTVAAVYTGEVAEGEGDGFVPVGDPDGDVEGVCAPDEDCEGPDLPSVEEKKPCVYVYGPNGIQNCTSQEFKGDPGTMNCGTVNGGAYTCTKKVPTSNGIQIDTTVKTQDNGDGTATTTKTDKITQVKCQGAGSCTTNVTTSVSNTVKNSNGETVSQTGECTGPACAGSSGSGDKDGDGLKDCAVGSTCEEENTEVGEQDFFTPGDDTMESVVTAFSERVAASPVVSAGSGFLTLPAGGSCPQWHASVWVFQIDIDQMCTTNIPWEVIRAIILSLASFVAFRWALL